MVAKRLVSGKGTAIPVIASSMGYKNKVVAYTKLVIYLIIFFIGSLSIVSKSYSENVLLSCSLNLEKKVFKLGEPIFLNFSLSNHSNGFVIISSRIYLENYLHLTITDENGNEAKFMGEMFKLPKVTMLDFLILSTQHFYGKRIDLLNGIEAFEINKPGKYTISGFYENHDKDELFKVIDKELLYSKEKFWGGKINLDPITFEIKGEIERSVSKRSVSNLDQ